MPFSSPRYFCPFSTYVSHDSTNLPIPLTSPLSSYLFILHSIQLSANGKKTRRIPAEWMENIREGADGSPDKPHPEVRLASKRQILASHRRFPGVPDWIAIIDSWKILSTYSLASRIFSASAHFHRFTLSIYILTWNAQHNHWGDSFFDIFLGYLSPIYHSSR